MLRKSEASKNYYSSGSEEEDGDLCSICGLNDIKYFLSKHSRLCENCTEKLQIPHGNMWGCSVCGGGGGDGRSVITSFTLKKNKFRMCEKCFKILEWKMKKPILLC